MMKEKKTTNKQEQSNSLKDFFTILFRYKWRMVLFFAAVVIAIIAYAFSLPLKYKSEAKLLVKLGPEKVIGSGETSDLVVPITPSERGKINAELEIIKSQNLAKAVASTLGPENILQANSQKSLPVQVSLYLQGRSPYELPTNNNEIERKAILNIRRNLVVRSVDPGNLIVISYTSQNPELARQVVAAVIDEYKTKYIETHHTAPTPVAFLDKVIEEEKGEVERIDKELEKITGELGVKFFALTQTLPQTRVTSLSSTLESIETSLVASRARVESLQASLAETPRKVDVQDPSASSIYVGEGGNGVVTVKRPNPVYQELEHDLMTELSNLAALEAQSKSVTTRLNDYRGQLTKISMNADQFDRLVREKEKHETRYNNYLANKEQVELDRRLEEERISNIVVFEPATAPLDSEPRGRAKVLFLGLIVALFGGIGIALGSEQLDHSIRKPLDVEEKVGVPTLTAIPKVGPKYSVIAERAGEYAIPSDVESHYKALKSRLLLATNGSVKPPQTFVVTSCSSGEGVSTVAANFAALLAASGDKKVLLVDANLSNPSVHRIFSAEQSPGLRDIVENGAQPGDVTRSSQIGNLKVIFSGQTGSNLTGMNDLDRLSAIINTLKSECDYLVIDAQPIKESTSAMYLARLVDGVILVVEAEKLRWEIVRQAKRDLEDSKAKVLGVVLNKRRYQLPKMLYERL